MKISFICIKYLCTICLLVPLVSCQAIITKYPSSYSSQRHAENETDYLLSEINNTNNKLETFKGIGNLKLIKEKKTINLRAAWMGTQQGCLRVEIFGFPGQSAAKYSNNGRFSYLYLPMEKRFYIIDDTNPSLEKILTISITANDLHSFLSGKVPINSYDFYDSNLTVTNDNYEVNLKKGCFGNRKKLYIDKTDKTVWKFETYTLFGSLKYRTELKKIRIVNGYTVPFEIIISNNQGNRLYIYLDKYWTDTSVPLSSFIITPPN